MNEKKEFKSLEDFTNLYDVQKTLRFELVAVPETDSILKNRGIWYAKDKKKALEKPIVKFYMDIIHREFTDESLLKLKEQSTLCFDNYFILFKELKNIKNQGFGGDKKLKTEKLKNKKKEISAELSKIRQVFKQEGFDIVDEEWKTKYISNGKKIKNSKSKSYLILSENILDFLSNRFTAEEINRLKNLDKKHADDYKNIFNEENKNVFLNFKKFFGYFDTLINNRKNFYQIDGKSGRIATRSIDENINFFAENSYIYHDEFSSELKNELSDEERGIFEHSYFKKCLLQKDITDYNLFVGRVNKKINKYNQHHEKRVAFLYTLYKQILSFEEKEMYKHIEINTDHELVRTLRDFIIINNEKVKASKLIFDMFTKRCMKSENLDQIFLSKDSMNTIAHRIFKPWEEVMFLFGKSHFISIDTFKKLTESLTWKERWEESQNAKSLIFKDTSLVKEESSIFINFIEILKKEYLNQFIGFERDTRRGKIEFIGYESAIKNLEEKIAWFEEKSSSLNDEEKSDWIKTIKEYADVSLRIFQMTKYLWLPITGDEEDKDYMKIKTEIEDLSKDNDFYNLVNEYIIGYEPFGYRMSFQEYLTRKPFLEDKFKINFENSRLLAGWDKDMIDDRTGILLRKKSEYFLGVLDINKRHCLDNLTLLTRDETEEYDLMQFKQLPGIYRNLPRIAFPKKKEPILKPTTEVKNIKEEFDEFQKQKKNKEIGADVKFDNRKLNILINHYRNFLKKNYESEKCYDFSSLDETKQYKNLADFYADVDKVTYSLSFVKIHLEELIRKGEIFLFKIKNKDFSEKSKGKAKNLHTYYFEALFETENLRSGRTRLGAGAQIFYRPASINKAEQINSAIQTKEKKQIINDKSQNPYHFKRYSEDKLFLHLPIELNADSYESPEINKNTFDFIKANKDNLRIIGIDRGEKNLAYFSVISKDANGVLKVEKCGDLNLGYLKPLDDLEKTRQDQRKSWQSIATIKNKRDGYISHAVREITKLILNNKAIVVFEDLSGNFKRSRMKFEKAPYQQLELALIKKLNYLVKKNATVGEPGHYLSAYQLTDEVSSYKDMGKQTGIIFYTQASYTSRTCPQCGWRKRLTGLYYKDRVSAKKRFDQKTGIQLMYNGDNRCFDFAYHPTYDQKELKEKLDNVSSDVTRVKWDSKKRENIQYKDGELTKKLEEILKNKGIILEQNINTQIQNVDDAGFWEDLINTLRLILEIRNTDNENGRDYIECPHCHFHSDKGFQGMAWNGDANGAYNIARKGAMIANIICDPKNKTDKLTWGDLKIDLTDWDKFTQK